MDYKDHWEKKEQEHEALCRRCGACCGAYDDPCIYLKKAGDYYFCDIYASRFGTRRTVGGELFNCVPVREILDEYWPYDHLCAYKSAGIL